MVQVHRELTGLNSSVTSDIKVVLVCDKTFQASMPHSSFVRARLGLLNKAAPPANAPYTLSNLDEVRYDLVQILPQKAQSYLLDSTDNEQLLFHPREEPLRLLTTEGLADFGGRLVWREELGGYVAQISPNTLITTSEASLEILRFYDHQMGEHLSSPVPLSRNLAGGWESKKALGGIDLVGKLLYLRFSNKKIPLMVILEQSQECLTATTNCRGFPLRSYGYALQTKDEAVVQIYITAREGRRGSRRRRVPADWPSEEPVLRELRRPQLELAQNQVRGRVHLC